MLRRGILPRRKNHIEANFAAAQKLTAELHRERYMYELLQSAIGVNANFLPSFPITLRTQRAKLQTADRLNCMPPVKGRMHVAIKRKIFTSRPLKTVT